jgi:hypothetical protein
MHEDGSVNRAIVNQRGLPPMFPTHRHPAQFWEALGRTIATFGFLEETLGKAIFAFTGTRPFGEEEVQEAYLRWLAQLERALTDQLWNLAEAYGKAVRDHPHATIQNLEELVADIKKGAEIRNVLCHGSWRAPDNDGASIPLFVNKKKEIFATPIDVAYLEQVQKHVAELACAVINTVTHMGWQFPGGAGPGKPIW